MDLALDADEMEEEVERWKQMYLDLSGPIFVKPVRNKCDNLRSTSNYYVKSNKKKKSK